ncbi:MAG: type II toxin-antitoxin system RelE/ParE family toxin [Verrucomicrobiota bacterium]
MKIEYHPAIAGELEEIRDYYEGQSAGLGRDFVDQFEQHILAISSMPTRWMIVRRDIRRTLMKRFPYVIHFRMIDDGAGIRVTVIKHERRHPAFGLSRS